VPATTAADAFPQVAAHIEFEVAPPTPLAGWEQTVILTIREAHYLRLIQARNHIKHKSCCVINQH